MPPTCAAYLDPRRPISCISEFEARRGGSISLRRPADSAKGCVHSKSVEVDYVEVSGGRSQPFLAKDGVPFGYK